MVSNEAGGPLESAAAEELADPAAAVSCLARYHRICIKAEGDPGSSQAADRQGLGLYQGPVRDDHCERVHVSIPKHTKPLDRMRRGRSSASRTFPP